MVVFTTIFALLIDSDFLFRKFVLKHKEKDTRTSLQEPFGLVLYILPIALVVGYFFGAVYVLLVMIPATSHVFLDYLCVHNVFPLAPFSKKKIKVGFVKDVRLPLRNFVNFSTVNENYVVLLNVVWLVILLL